MSTDEVKDDTKPQSHPSQQVSLKLSTIVNHVTYKNKEKK